MKTTAELNDVLEHVKKLKSEGRKLFRLDNSLECAVPADELIAALEDLVRAVMEKETLGAEPSILEKFAVKVLIENGVCLY